jgi:hypothetical protein
LRPTPQIVAREEELRRERVARCELELPEGGVEERYMHTDPELAGLPDAYRRVWQRLLGLLDRPQLVMLVGPRGVGKTALACALVRRYREGDAYNRAYIRDTADLLNEIIGAPWEHKNRIRERYRRAGLVVLDELQERDGSRLSELELVGLINARYAARRVTVLLSNLSREAVPENVGDSIWRRLSEEGGIHVCAWQRIDPVVQQMRAASSKAGGPVGRAPVRHLEAGAVAAPPPGPIRPG